MPKDDKGKLILVLLDGCASCHKGWKNYRIARVTHRDEDGGFFSKCSDIEEYEAFRVSELDIKVEANNKVDMATVGFSVPVHLRIGSAAPFFLYRQQVINMWI
uniref:Uncharacterized protein n=1 Tax=Meloidogyne incognita TaxID=6306 RepID=A0A914MDJ9_MELIC